MSLSSSPSGMCLDRSIPNFERMLAVAAGLDRWSFDELRIKNSSQAWHVDEAKAFLALAMLQTTEMQADEELRKAIAEVAALTSVATRKVACDYLGTFLSEDLHGRYDALSRSAIVRWEKEAKRGKHKAGHWNNWKLLTVAAGLLVALILSYVAINRFGDLTDDELAFAEIRISRTDHVAGTMGSPDRHIFSDETFKYEIYVKTKLPVAWIININQDGFNIEPIQELTRNTANGIKIEKTLPPHARDTIEYVIVLLAEESMKSDREVQRERLVHLQEELLQYDFDNDLNGRFAEEAVRKFLKASGFTDGVKIKIERFERHHETRN
jgi:hypothetical protein